MTRLLDRKQASDRSPAVGNDNLLATLDCLQKGRELLPGLRNSDLTHRPSPVFCLCTDSLNQSTSRRKPVQEPGRLLPLPAIEPTPEEPVAAASLILDLVIVA